MKKWRELPMHHAALALNFVQEAMVRPVPSTKVSVGILNLSVITCLGHAWDMLQYEQYEIHQKGKQS
jgi:hypothetical protein